MNNTAQQISNEEATKAQNPYMSYCAGKKVGEQAIWDYVKKENPSYSVTVLLPPLIFGPPIQDVKTMKNMNFSNDVFYSLWNGTYQEVPSTTFPAYVSFFFFGIIFELEGNYEGI